MAKGIRKKIRRFFIWLLLACFFFVVCYYHKQTLRIGYKAYRWYRHQQNPRAYANGLIDYPAGYTVHGIDVSRWQDVVDWTKLKALTPEGDTLHFQFAFIKATEGILIEDPMFDGNWKDAKQNHVIRGAYHYFLPNSDPVMQAKNFISSVEIQKGDLPPVVDVEEIKFRGKTDLIKKLKIYISLIEKHYHVKPIIYSNISFIEDYLADDFKNYSFWIAHYYEEELIADDSIHWLFWQHSDKAGMFGCSYPLDVNVFNGNLNDFKKVLVK